MNSNDTLSQVFDIEPIDKTNTIVSTNNELVLPRNDALEQDYQTTRSNLHSILNQGQDALYHALEVAKNSEHPRAFEVVGGLMKNLSDINTQLLDLHKRKQQVEGPKESAQKNVTNNSIFVGSTADLGKMLNDLKKGK
jgi:hypothetical protein